MGSRCASWLMCVSFCISWACFEARSQPFGAQKETHMSQEAQREPMSKKRVVYTVPGMEAVTVRRDEPYRMTDSSALAMDLYYPPDSKAGTPTPAVIFVTGFPDLDAEKMIGSRFE